MTGNNPLKRKTLPFSAIIGQDEMKLALLLNAVNPAIGGVLIRGEKGTAKSTAARALADLLPEIEVVSGCSFGCSPDDPELQCDRCRERYEQGGILERDRRRVRVVTLPLGSTEDRVVGTVDVERAIREGICALEPGVLAAANRGILYIDEVNLLDDHVVDILLDAAVTGINIVEREGISLAHPARFILIGTMNPEEGELRPQLLDRFGLQVTVGGITDLEERMRVVETVGAFEADPDRFLEVWEPEQERLRRAVVRARALLPGVTIGRDLTRQVVAACLSLGVMTHRAELTVIRTARTIAALEGRDEVLAEDVKRAMALAIPHRMRKRPFEEPKLDPETLDSLIGGDDIREDGGGDNEPDDSPSSGGSDGDGTSGRTGKEREQVFSPGDAVDPGAIRPAEPDRVIRKASGRRKPVMTRRGGRSVSVRQGREDLDLVGTVRAAAPHQRRRDRGALALAVEPGDLRQKVRRGSAPVGALFVVDASGSMGTERRMESAKGAVLSLISDSYIHRDRVGLVAFRGSGADLVLPMTHALDRAALCLAGIPTGGRTPLAAGLLKGLEVLLSEQRKNPDLVPLLVLISDCRPNTGSGGSIREEVVRASALLGERGIRTVVIDTETSSPSIVPLSLGFGRTIAEHAGGRYYRISDLTAGGIGAIVRYEQGLSVESENKYA
ncbi:magnesium chelatase subunit D family protein [Methanofollis tationis]|uniref:Magnesium chelatase subunit D family protein n=1 Tax=Methanofollis tationis TaxID=81417 RepID=A0A7K4HRL3_9EURY|nr:magnesium chelatase subunit D family protein [Methanofollis tationis]NVO67923.1 magnesium chelatase subunit D family protein [Methanofollis tationis]